MADWWEQGSSITSASYSYATTSTANATTVWRGWQDQGTASSSTTWETWTNQWFTFRYQYLQESAWQQWVYTQPTVGGYQPLAETDEQRRRRLAMEREALEAHRAREADRKAASERAAMLLIDHLDEGQREAWSRERRFRVRGSRGGVYDICAGRSGNVYRLDEQGRRVAQLCIHPSSEFPEPDVHLTQKLMIETDEEAFERIANVTRLAGPVVVDAAVA